MSRAGYDDDCGGDPRDFAMWRGQVASAIRGKRGQAFLRELVAALDAMPEKRLIAEELEKGGEVCAIGAVGKARGVAMGELDPDEPGKIAATFGIADPLVREIEYMNDEAGSFKETPEGRWARMRAWVERQIAAKAAP